MWMFSFCVFVFSIATVMTNLGKLGHNHSTFSWHLKWHILFMVRTKLLKHCRISAIVRLFSCVLKWISTKKHLWINKKFDQKQYFVDFNFCKLIFQNFRLRHIKSLDLASKVYLQKKKNLAMILYLFGFFKAR